jgi:hypothetical protein
MRINEVEMRDNGKLVALSQFLLNRAQDENVAKTFSTASFIKLASQMGIPLTVDQLKQMVGQPPLSHIIANVEGDDRTGRIVFKGAGEDADTQGTKGEMNTDQAQNVVANMAKRAQK